MHTQRRLIRPADGRPTTNGIDWRTDDGATRRGDHWTPAAPAAMLASGEFPSDGVLLRPSLCTSLPRAAEGDSRWTASAILHNEGKTERKIQITQRRRRSQSDHEFPPFSQGVSERARRPQTLNATNGQTEPGARVVDSSLFPSSGRASGCHAT